MSNALRPHKLVVPLLESEPVSGDEEPSARYGRGSRSLLLSRYSRYLQRAQALHALTPQLTFYLLEELLVYA